MDDLLVVVSTGTLSFIDLVDRLADAVSAARRGDPAASPAARRTPLIVTDWGLEAACVAYHEANNGEGSWARASDNIRGMVRARMSAALAALEAQSPGERTGP